ncbi:TadE/TadG family type IV pilus assembly protein [Micromonospora sp. DT47]|uniref:TadE/TadG family type IV pilus assembly protein n=1 Tax=Micromonospora sp. DT47 TaxID=3393431 RepID=UPI003CF7A274
MDHAVSAAADRRTRGSVSVEVAVLAPAFITLVVLAGVAGRVAVADEAVEAAAHDAARAASISRDAPTAKRAAEDAARRQLDWRGLNCAGAPQVSVWGSTGGDGRVSLTTAYGRPLLGEPVSIWVRVSCAVSLDDIRFPGLSGWSGTKRVEATFASPLDSYRSRG